MNTCRTCKHLCRKNANFAGEIGSPGRFCCSKLRVGVENSFHRLYRHSNDGLDRAMGLHVLLVHPDFCCIHYEDMNEVTDDTND